LAAGVGIWEARAEELRVAVITGQSPIRPHTGVPMEVDEPRDDEAIRRGDRAVRRACLILADIGNAVILPHHHAVPDEDMCPAIEADHDPALQLGPHALGPPSCTIWLLSTPRRRSG
jgi:hypothetical protein